VRGKVLVQQALPAHPLQLAQHQGEIIDAFTADVQGLGQAETLPQFLELLPI